VFYETGNIGSVRSGLLGSYQPLIHCRKARCMETVCTTRFLRIIQWQLDSLLEFRAREVHQGDLERVVGTCEGTGLGKVARSDCTRVLAIEWHL